MAHDQVVRVDVSDIFSIVVLVSLVLGCRVNHRKLTQVDPLARQVVQSTKLVALLRGLFDGGRWVLKRLKFGLDVVSQLGHVSRMLLRQAIYIVKLVRDLLY